MSKTICKHRETGKLSVRYNDGANELWWTGEVWSVQEAEAKDYLLVTCVQLESIPDPSFGFDPDKTCVNCGNSDKFGKCNYWYHRGEENPELKKLRKQVDQLNKLIEQIVGGEGFEVSKTGRNFDLIVFNDLYDQPCSLQKSSSADTDAIWLGLSEAHPKIMAKYISQNGTGWVDYHIPSEVLINTRMHLNREQVKKLLPHLVKFVETGGI